MNEKNKRIVSDSSWTEWKEQCSIGNCKRPETVAELTAFGKNRLAKALSRYDGEMVYSYCHEDPKRAWLVLEEFLYAGIGKRGKRAGKSYKDALFLQAVNLEHLEALISRQISQELTRHLLHAEGYIFSQGESGISAKRDAEEFSEEHEEIYVEPTEDEDAVVTAAQQQAEIIWNTMKKKSERIMLTCLLNNRTDIAEILSADILPCVQSQAYHIRKKILKTIETLEWPGCTEVRQKAYMTRRMIPFLYEKSRFWIEESENHKIKLFIYGEG